MRIPVAGHSRPVRFSRQGAIIPISKWHLLSHYSPQVYIKHPAVSRYIVGGADLMLPGVLLPPGGLPPFQKDGLVAVCSPGGALSAAG